MTTRSHPSAAVRAQDAAYGTHTKEPLRPVQMTIAALCVVAGLGAGLPFLGKVISNAAHFNANYEGINR